MARNHSHTDDSHSHSHLHHAHSHSHNDPHYSHSHRHDSHHSHSHGPSSHGHAHTFAHGASEDVRGQFALREPFRVQRDYNERAFTVGVGGPVGSGKTALVHALCQLLKDSYSIVVVTNDIFTQEDCEFLHRHQTLGKGNNPRIRAVETGSCPHAAVREDCSANLAVVRQLTAKFKPVDLAFVESGGDNLSANFSRDLADCIIYVIDVAGGDKVPRKGGPGITQSDLLVINKTDLSQAVGADLPLMRKQAKIMRSQRNDLTVEQMNDISDEELNGTGAVVMAQVKNGGGVKEIARHILQSMKEAGVIEEIKLQQSGSESVSEERVSKKQKT